MAGILIVNKNNELIAEITNKSTKLDSSVDFIENNVWMVIKLENNYNTNWKLKCIKNKSWWLNYKNLLDEEK